MLLGRRTAVSAPWLGDGVRDASPTLPANVHGGRPTRYLLDRRASVVPLCTFGQVTVRVRGGRDVHHASHSTQERL
ncbi:hypothetical protein D779_3403 [Imhoffiella purpurea]|uniref:Uncharacterized protein n=1 Tax=Imhoffiella purpurea TaxID=1249627 RepID=W9VI78_9GAMM|nr:hypothetical protein D779_3403 [Imhoffiella purpurea]